MNKVNERIDLYLKETLINLASDVKNHNDTINAICENYYNPAEDEALKRESYKLFCNALHNYNAHVPIPSFDEWCLHPLRPIDHIAGFEQEIIQKEDNFIYPSQSDIDHVIIQVLMKEYTDSTKHTIDISKIYECLSYIMNYDYEEYDVLFDEYNPHIKIPKDEQEEYIQANRRYFSYKKMLKELKFIK